MIQKCFLSKCQNVKKIVFHDQYEKLSRYSQEEQISKQTYYYKVWRIEGWIYFFVLIFDIVIAGVAINEFGANGLLITGYVLVIISEAHHWGRLAWFQKTQKWCEFFFKNYEPMRKILFVFFFVVQDTCSTKTINTFISISIT